MTKLSSTVLDGLDRLQAIVGDLLALARLDAGAGQRPRPSRPDRPRLRRMPEPPHHHKTITCALEPDATVIGDRLRLCCLLANSSSTTRNATPKPRSRSPSTTSRTTTSSSCTASPWKLDDGTGIEPDKRELVFQRFATPPGRGLGSKDPGGTGLGLPIAWHIAEASGGTLTPRTAHAAPASSSTCRSPHHRTTMRAPRFRPARRRPAGARSTPNAWRPGIVVLRRLRRGPGHRWRSS